MNAGSTLRVASVVTTLLGLLLLLGSWDGLYERLDLPQALPALGPQLGGVALISLGFLEGSAASSMAMQRPAALAGAVFYLGSAAVTVAWLVFKDKVDLGIGDTGWAILIVSAVVFAGLGVALARSARA
jgi:hypothetical protein